MNKPDKRIVDFIGEHHVLTIATCYEEEPYCANCFYIYLEDSNQLVFTSDNNTKHIKDTAHNIMVGGSIVLETSTIGLIRGLQFQGYISELTDDDYKKARKAYIKKFPYAILKKTILWSIDLTFMKFTDNRLGFGKKIIWKNSDLTFSFPEINKTSES